jgi:hypothetical protein
MMCFAWDVDLETAEDDLEHIVVPTYSKGGLLRAWKLLQELPALSELELDAILLTNPNAVKVFRQKALKNLRRIEFVQAVPRTTRKFQAFVWPRQASRKMIGDSDLAEDVARGIKGMRYGWSRNKSSQEKKATGFERQRYLTRFEETYEEKINGGRNWRKPRSIPI